MPKLITTIMLAGLLSACATTTGTATSGEPEAEASSERMVRRCESSGELGSNRGGRTCRMVPAGS